MTLYYKIEDDLDISNRWMVGNLNLPESYAWDDVESNSPIDTVDWTVEVQLSGKPLNVTILILELIMANMRFINLLPSQEIDYKKINILNYTEKEPYFLVGVKMQLIALTRVDQNINFGKRIMTLDPTWQANLNILLN